MEWEFLGGSRATTSTVAAAICILHVARWSTRLYYAVDPSRVIEWEGGMGFLRGLEGGGVKNGFSEGCDLIG